MSLDNKERTAFFRIKDKTELPAVWLCWGLGEGACIMCHWQVQPKAGTCEHTSVLHEEVTVVEGLLEISFL